MAPGAISSEKAKRAGEAGAAQSALKQRLADKQKAKAGKKSTANVGVNPNVAGPQTRGSSGRMQKGLNMSKSYQKIGRMLAEALGWTL